MSGEVTNWNTKEIRDFKETFKKRAQWSPFGKPTAGSVAQTAVAMLKKRQEYALNTLEKVSTEKTEERVKLLGELTQMSVRLDEQTKAIVSLKFDAMQEKELDTTADAASQLTDRWVQFEGRCLALIAPGSDMDDAKLRAAAMQQADQLIKFASELRVECQQAISEGGSGEFQTIQTEIGETLKPVGSVVTAADGKPERIAKVAEFLKIVNECRVALRDWAAKLAKARKGDTPMPGGKSLNDTTLEGLYGIELNPTKPNFPYGAFMDALAMIPPEHATNAMLKSLQYETLKAGGADYSSSEKRIRIDPAVRVDRTQSYINPETKQPEPVNSFAVTTLHEVGHSVDAAYRIMEQHGTKAECGGWSEVDPTVYMGDNFAQFAQKLRQKVGKPISDDACGAANVSECFVKYMIKRLDADKFEAEMGTAWKKDAENAKDDKMKATGKPTADLNQYLSDLFAGPFADDNAENGLNLVKTGCPGPMATLTVGEFKTFDTGAFDDEFKNCFPDWPKSTGKVDKAPIIEFVQMAQVMTHMTWMQDFESAKDAIDTFATFAKSVLPPQVDLSAYLSTQSPWKTDLSNAKIGDKDAAHEAYEGDTKWVRYSHAARAAKVTDYQFRAPAEWFAELYAITWFKKVEPPSSVGKDAAVHLYGGHAT
jgi:hypothetical protein